MEGQSTIKITVLIAGRPYPLRINAADEPAVRKIVKDVNDKITSFQASYVDRDKQDGLSMAVLTYAFDLFKLRREQNRANDTQVDAQLADIDELLDSIL